MKIFKVTVCDLERSRKLDIAICDVNGLPTYRKNAMGSGKLEVPDWNFKLSGHAVAKCDRIRVECYE